MGKAERRVVPISTTTLPSGVVHRPAGLSFKTSMLPLQLHGLEKAHHQGKANESLPLMNVLLQPLNIPLVLIVLKRCHKVQGQQRLHLQ
mmetsp:Transcript_17874/g.25140  ORF Transcript_17874/g.25140 Transcript_17874/m.25140 type:complete len:89 (-) Transcript_17874:380-646(-)